MLHLLDSLVDFRGSDCADSRLRLVVFDGRACALGRRPVDSAFLTRKVLLEELIVHIWLVRNGDSDCYNRHIPCCMLRVENMSLAVIMSRAIQLYPYCSAAMRPDMKRDSDVDLSASSFSTSARSSGPLRKSVVVPYCDC